MMLRRNLLYTAITRAKKLVVLVGSPRALAMAVENDSEARRHSGLASRLSLQDLRPRTATPGSVSNDKP